MTAIDPGFALIVGAMGAGLWVVIKYRPRWFNRGPAMNVAALSFALGLFGSSHRSEPFTIERVVMAVIFAAMMGGLTGLAAAWFDRRAERRQNQNRA